MGFWSGVCDFVSGACRAIGGAVSAIGGATIKVIGECATTIAKLGVDLATKVGEIIKAVAISLGILRPQDQLDELGEKAMLSDKKPEDFDSINDYINHLRNDVKIDKEKFESLSKEELLARSSIGAAITLKGINEKLDTVVTPEFMAEVAKQELKAEEICATIKSYKENGLDTSKYSLYINDELPLDECAKHREALIAAYQKLEPELSLNEIKEKVMDLK